MSFATIRVLASATRWLPLSCIVVAAACATTPKPIQSVVDEGPVIEVNSTEGKIHGVTEGKIYVFKGIPYGAPVDGLNRWLPPRPPAKRDGVFDARSYGPACEQTVGAVPHWMLSKAGEVATIEMGGMELHAAEKKSPDCLRLNIWTPTLPEASTSTGSSGDAPKPTGEASSAPSSAPAEAQPVAEEPTSESAEAQVAPQGLPVMVMLHGGGLAMASAASRAQVGTVLAGKGAVVVGLNYRLGPIGFLAGDGLFKGDLLKGNRGFMDTVRALEWIRDNIARFGGDPSNVTLMGQSGGGTNVWSVLASPSSKGLVRRAIIMSGPINQVSIDDHKKLTKAVLKKWKVNPGDAAALAAVKTEDAISTVNTTTLVGNDGFGELSRMYLPNTGAYGTEFMPDDVFSAIQKGRLNDIDLLVGNCNNDGRASTAAVPLPDSMAIDIWNGYIGGMIAATKEGEKKMAAKYIAAMPEVDATRAKEQLQTDALYRLRALRAAELHSQATPGEDQGHTYAYQFNWKSPCCDGKLGAIHGLDLIFAFGNLGFYPIALGIQDGRIDPAVQRLSNQMADAWLNFARSGKPSSDLLPAWPEYEPGARQTMVFDKESKVVADPGGKLRKLWE